MLTSNITYISQDKDFYRVSTQDGTQINISKVRSPQNLLVMPSKSKIFKSPFKFLVFAFFGLPFAGLITIICAPIVIYKSYNLLKNGALSDLQKSRAKNFILSAGTLFILGLPLSVLFVMHLIF